MASPLSGGFKVNAREAIDIRLVLSKTEMKTQKYEADGKTIALPSPYFCLCKDDDNIYIYDANNPEDAETGKFKLYSSGGSGTTDFEQLENRPKHNGVVMDKNTNIEDYDDTELAGRVSTIEGKEAGWDAKQNAISDLDDIRSNASAAKATLDEKAAGWDAKQDAISDLDDIRENASEGAAAKATLDEKAAGWDAKQNAISDLDDIRSKAAAGKTASDNLGGHTVAKNVPADAVFTDTVYDDTELSGRVEDVEEGKMDKKDGAEEDNIATFDENGDVKDSGFSIEEVALPDPIDPAERQYLVDAEVDENDILDIEKSDGTHVQFQGGGGGNYQFENSIEKHGNKVMLPSIEETNDVVYAISDSQGNAVFVINKNGKADFNLSDELIAKLQALGLGGGGGAAEPEFDALVFYVPCVGQSLAINTGAGASTFTGNAPYSYNTSLNPANLQDMNGGFTEAFKIMAAYYGVHIPKNFKIVTTVTGGGGQSINVFGKGSSYYNQVISNVRTVYNACQAAGLTMIVPGFMWTQGEEDMRTGGNKQSYGSGQWDPFQYHTKLKNMIDSYNTDIKAITGQTQDVCCFSYQVCTQTRYNRYPRIAFEQELLAEQDNRMLMAKPMYNVDYNTSDYVHAPSGTYRNMGNHYGIACFKKFVLKEKFKWVHPIKYTLNGTTLDIEFEVPVKPLVLDTTLVSQLADNNYGFCIYNVPNEISNSTTVSGISKATTTITGVKLINATTVRLTLSRTPVAGERLTYGHNGDGWENITGTNISGTTTTSGHVTGPRGCLRDSYELKNAETGATIPDLYNWSVIFEHVFE